MPEVIDLGRSDSLRHFLFGSTPDVLERLSERLLKAYPGADIVGRLSPPFGSWTSNAEATLLEKISSTRPDVVWCALGAPRQELWMRRIGSALAPAVLLGVGAAFDFLAGSKPRAPLWMQQVGLEWLHRLASEPRRLGARYFRTNTEYVVRALAAIGMSR
jgi:N-acetylglucosaminyldiphosphoundecaprenol N-acetyl-beta-D-mannosaminyltransferase